MVVGKKKTMAPRHTISQSSLGTFDDSVLYQLITTSPADQVAGAMREAIFSNYEDVHLTCPDTGMTYLHLIADNYEKFCDPRALPAVYMLCYVGIDVSAQDKEEEGTVLHRLVRKPGAHKLIIALLRYGVDVSVSNRHNQTAEQYLEAEQPPGYKETIHWFRKLYPGLHCFVSSDSEQRLTLENAEQLLKGWCKVNIYKKGKPLNLLHDSQMRAKDALLAELFKKYYWTNEFVHATLAGLPDEMKRIYKEGKKRIDVDTVDHSYQLYMDSPIAPQPLVASTWEQSNYDVIDQLLVFNADVCNSYSSQPDTNPVKPLFYQTLLGTPRVTDINVLLRILQEGDLRCKTETSSTFLHESVKFNLPAPFVAKLLSLDVPLEERNNKGQTARELALQENKLDLVQVLDDLVVDAAREGDIKRLEILVLNSYEIDQVKSADGKTLAMLAENKEVPSKTAKFIQSIPELQTQMLQMWSCMYRNDLVQLKKCLNNKDLKRAVYSRNKCGRSILLIAILNRNKEAIRMILKKHSKLVEYFDNNMLTCLHYAYLMFEGKDKEPAQMLQAAGASVDWCCTHGMSAYFYQKGVMEDETFYVVQNVVSGVALMILPERELFEEAFTQACMTGNLSEVVRLADHLRPWSSVSVLGNILFDVIDAKQEDVAIYLLEEGCDRTQTKQYEICSPANELCAMMECFHPRSTLSQRAKVNQLPRLYSLLTEEEMHETNGIEHQEAMDMEVDPETGMVINGHQRDSAMNELTAQFTEDTRL